jgi:preprotein translocase subunit Sec61beta
LTAAESYDEEELKNEIRVTYNIVYVSLSFGIIITIAKMMQF